MITKKLRILVFIDWYLPGTKAGGPVRSIFSLVNLLKDDIEFGIVTRNTDLGNKSEYKGILTDTWTLIEGQRVYYFSPSGINDETILDLIEHFQPQLIYLNSFWSNFFSIKLVRLRKKGVIKVPILLAPRGMLSSGAMSLKRTKKMVYLVVAKVFGWYKNIVFHATQNVEKSDILSFFPRSKILIAPNVNTGEITENNSIKEINELKLFYLSRIAEVKNLHFALQCLALVPKHVRITYSIYGNEEDADYLKYCQEIANSLPPNIHVEWKGEISFYLVQKKLIDQQVLLLPTLNENYGHSIVEALLSGCPVIISDQTPWNDLEKHGCGFALPLNSKFAFVTAITKFGEMNAVDFKEASKKANNYIRRKVNLPEIKQQYLKLFNDCAKN